MSQHHRQKVLQLCLLLAALLHLVKSSHSIDTPFETLFAEERIRGVRQRGGVDFVLGGLFPVHSDDADSGGARCGAVRLERGLERMEAMLFALDEINYNSLLLPGLSLGFDIRDTCNSENIGLDESIDLIITGSRLDIESCSPSATLFRAVNSSDVAVAVPTSGIVGAASSRVSVPVASLVRLFRTPQISYASSSAILSNRDRYEYFYRTIPPDNQQAKAMVDLLLHFNWTYVSTIYSRNPYGEPGIVEFKELAGKKGVCIDIDYGIEDTDNEEDFSYLAHRLTSSRANIVILFASQDNADKLLSKVANSTSSRRFTWIASDAWARSINVVHKFNETAAGLYGFAPLTNHVKEFERYFSNLSIESNQRNPWFPEFYSAFVGCDLNETSENPCDHHASIAAQPNYQQGNFIPLVIDAVYTFAHALHNFLDDNCDRPWDWSRTNLTCRGQKRDLDGPALLEYIANANCMNEITGDQILFDSDGNVEGMYEILNYQASDVNGREYSFVRVGTWDSSVTNDSHQEALTILNVVVPQFGVDESGSIVYDTPSSQCGNCDPGHYLLRVQSSCCGICQACVGRNYSIDPLEGDCMECGDEYWGNDPLDGSTFCVKLPESFLKFSNPWSIIIMMIAGLGLFCVGFVTSVFMWFWSTSIVKSSGREQMSLLLVGIGLSFALAFIYVSPPVLPICYIQRLGVWFCFSLMFGSLLVKIVRVARIFLRRSTLSRPRFTEPHYQILFTFLIVLVQMILVSASIAYQLPRAEKTVRVNQTDNHNFPEIVMTCEREAILFVVLSVVYQTLIIIVATVLGVLSFKYPDNFNEAKSLFLCTFCVLVIWIAFIPSYFATQSTREYRNAALSFAVVMSAFAVLSCLFGPRVYILLFKPAERNIEHYSTHQGGFKSELQSQNSFRAGSNASLHSTHHSISTLVTDVVARGDKKGDQFLHTNGNSIFMSSVGPHVKFSRDSYSTPLHDDAERESIAYTDFEGGRAPLPQTPSDMTTAIATEVPVHVSVSVHSSPSHSSPCSSGDQSETQIPDIPELDDVSGGCSQREGEVSANAEVA